MIRRVRRGSGVAERSRAPAAVAERGKGRSAPGAKGRGVLAALVNNIDGVFQKSVLHGAEEVAAAHGLSVEAVPLGAIADDRELQATLDDVTSGALGVLVLANAIDDVNLTALATAGVTVTLVSHYASALRLPTMMFDNYQGVEQLVRHLVIDCGRRRPLFIGGDPSQLDAQERLAAFNDEALRHDLVVPPSNVLVADFTPRVAAGVLADFLEGGAEFDSLLAADYLMAIAAKRTLTEAGVRVPHDVAVVGFGDGPEAEEAGVTSVAADVVELGRRAARQLVAQLEGKQLAGRTLLSTHLVRRASSC